MQNRKYLKRIHRTSRIYIKCFVNECYSRLTLVVTFWEASHISSYNTLYLLLNLYIVSHTPGAIPICEKNFIDFCWEIYERQNEKYISFFKKLSGFDFNPGSTSGLTGLLWFWDQCTVARDICDSLIDFFICFANMGNMLKFKTFKVPTTCFYRQLDSSLTVPGALPHCLQRRTEFKIGCKVAPK